MFAKEFPQTPMYQLLKVFENIHKFDNNYFLCNGKLEEQKVHYICGAHQGHVMLNIGDLICTEEHGSFIGGYVHVFCCSSEL